MQPPHKHSRINLAELKAQINKSLGAERSNQYFNYLNKFLSLKLSKVEFNKLCLRIVGRENIPLHNQFIHSILKNACTTKTPPPNYDVELQKPTRAVGNKEHPGDGCQYNGSHPSITQSSNPPALLNGDILPLSPRKARTGIRRGALGPNGKINSSYQQLSTTRSGDSNVILANGDLTLPDICKPVHHHQEGEVLGHYPVKLQQSPGGPQPVLNKDQNELLVREHGKEASARSLLHAPLGVPFCPLSVGGSRRALPLAGSSKCVSSLISGGLLDSVTLRERVQQIAAAQGLEGVSMDCANVVNNGLDSYLKGLIRSSVELVVARSGQGPMKNITHRQKAQLKLVNGFRPGHHYQMQSSSRPLEVMQEHRPYCPISLLDFRVAMEMNPQQLGEDWPLLLEKICTLSFEE